MKQSQIPLVKCVMLRFVNKMIASRDLYTITHMQFIYCSKHFQFCGVKVESLITIWFEVQTFKHALPCRLLFLTCGCVVKSVKTCLLHVQCIIQLISIRILQQYSLLNKLTRFCVIELTLCCLFHRLDGNATAQHNTNSFRKETRNF